MTHQLEDLCKALTKKDQAEILSSLLVSRLLAGEEADKSAERARSLDHPLPVFYADLYGSVRDGEGHSPELSEDPVLEAIQRHLNLFRRVLEGEQLTDEVDQVTSLYTQCIRSWPDEDSYLHGHVAPPRVAPIFLNLYLGEHLLRAVRGSTQLT